MKTVPGSGRRRWPVPAPTRRGGRRRSRADRRLTPATRRFSNSLYLPTAAKPMRRRSRDTLQGSATVLGDEGDALVARRHDTERPRAMPQRAKSARSFIAARANVEGHLAPIAHLHLLPGEKPRWLDHRRGGVIVLRTNRTRRCRSATVGPGSVGPGPPPVALSSSAASHRPRPRPEPCLRLRPAGSLASSTSRARRATSTPTLWWSCSSMRSRR